MNSNKRQPIRGRVGIRGWLSLYAGQLLITLSKFSKVCGAIWKESRDLWNENNATKKRTETHIQGESFVKCGGLEIEGFPETGYSMLLSLWWWAVWCRQYAKEKKRHNSFVIRNRTMMLENIPDHERISVTIPVCLFLGLKLSLSSRHPPGRRLCQCRSRPARRWRYCFIMYMPLERGQHRSLTLSGVRVSENFASLKLVSLS